MNNTLKQRLVGAVVLVALAVIFIPMLLDTPDPTGSVTVSTEIPPLPEQQPLNSAPSGDSEELEPLQQPAPNLVKRAPETESAVAEPHAAPMAEPQPQAPAESPAEPPAPPVTPEPTAPAPRASAAAPASPAKDGDTAAWVVQVGSFSLERNALALRDRLRGKGFSAFVEPLVGKDGTVYRVRVGPEKERTGADALRDRLEQTEKLKGLVTSYP